MQKLLMKYFKKIFLLIFLIFFFCSCTKEESDLQNVKFSIKDDLNREISFDSTPKRIISLAPNLTEMIYVLRSEKYLIGNTLYCKYPAAAKRITKVGDLLSFDYEKIVSLKPDLIFITVEGNTKETYERFRELGLKIFVSNPRNYEGIKRTILKMSKIFKIDTAADRMLNLWDLKLDEIKEKSNKYPPASVMFLVELRPIMLAGSSTFINEYIVFCGLKNIASNSPLNYPVYSREEVLKRDPEYIVYPSDGTENISIIKNAYPEWQNLQAVKKGNIIFADRNLYFRPGPRFIDALNDFFNKLHPEESRNFQNRR